MSDNQDTNEGLLWALAGVGVAGLVWGITGGVDPAQGPNSTETGRRTRDCTCRRYVHLFREFGRPLGIPTAYLQALACRESRCNPNDREGPAWGLMQITPIVQQSERRLDGKPGIYRRDELFDPRISVYLCTRTLGRAMRVLSSLGFPPDWTNPKWVSLLTAGWNAGYSRKAGVGLVLTYLLQRNRRRETIDSDVIHRYAERAGATPHLWQVPGRPLWWRSVVRLYFTLIQQEQIA